MALAFLMSVWVLVGFNTELSAQATQLSPLGSNQTSLSGCDDCNGSVSLTSVFSNGIDFGGTIYNELYISTNGYITFGHGNSSYSPLGIAAYTQGPIVAPQFDDLDPRKGGDIFYNQNTAEGYVVVTWRDVMPYNGPDFGSGTNTLQAVLRRLGGPGSRDFQIEIRYVRLDWAKAAINSANPTGGWSAGDQATYAEVPLSGQSTFRDLQTLSNVGETGVFRWNVEGGIVESQPTVNQTTAPTSITGSSAESGGNISSNGGHPVTDRGLVWSTSAGPTLSDASVSSGTGEGSFTASITGLSASTTYFVRAYGTNTLGTAYGPERSFTTLSSVPPSVTTGSASALTSSSAEVSGEVTADGGSPVTTRGIVWASDPAPTTADGNVAAGTGTGGFTAEISGLDPVTTYYARAYATNAQGTTYGADISFTTDQLSQSISFARLESRTYGDAPQAISASASSGLDVGLASSNPSVATIDGGMLVIRGAGNTQITATQNGSALYAAAAPVSRTLQVQPRPIQGSFTIEAEKIFDQTTTAIITGLQLTGVLSADQGQVELVADGAEFNDPQVGGGKSATLVGAALSGERAEHYSLALVEPASGDILPAPPHHITLEGPGTFDVGSPSGLLTLTIRDEYGNATPLSQSTRFALQSDVGEGATFIGTDGQELRQDNVRIPEGGTVAFFRYTNTSAGQGTHRVTSTRASGETLAGGIEAHHDLATDAGPWVGLRVEVIGGGSSGIERGEPFQIRVVAVDRFGNQVRGIRAPIQLSSAGPLSIPTGLEGELSDGVIVFSNARFADVGQYTIEARGSEASGLADASTVEVLNPRPDVRFTVNADRSSAGPSDIVVFTVRAENLGAGPAHDLRLESPLGNTNRLEIVEVTSTGGEWNNDSGVWTIDVLDAGAEVELTIRARPTED